MNRLLPDVHQMKQKITHKMMICQDVQEGLFWVISKQNMLRVWLAAHYEL